MPTSVGLLALWMAGATAQASEVVVLQWPGTQLTFEDAKLQKSITKVVPDATFVSDEKIVPENADKRTFRRELLNSLAAQEDKCDPVVKVRQAPALKTYGAKGPFFIAIAIDGSNKNLKLWKYESEALKLVDKKLCP